MPGPAARITTPSALLCSTGHWVSNQFKASPELLPVPSIFVVAAMVLASLLNICNSTHEQSKHQMIQLTALSPSLTRCLDTAIQLVDELFFRYKTADVKL